MCVQISACGQLAEMMRDPRLAWVLIQEASQQQRSDELTEIAVNLYGQLGEAQAEVSRLRMSLRGPRTASISCPATDAAAPAAVASGRIQARIPVGGLRALTMEG